METRRLFATPGVAFTAVNPTTGNTYHLLAASSRPDAATAAAGLGGALVKVNDAAENAWLAATFVAKAPNLWIGLSDAVTEGKYLWPDGTAAAYTNWDTSRGQPNDPTNAIDEDFALLVTATGKWFDQGNVLTIEPGLKIAGVVEVAKPTVSLVATDAAASEPGTDKGVITVSRTGPTTAALTVALTRGGTATNGTDYTSLATSVTIAAGKSSAAIGVAPKDDTAVEGSESVTLTLAGGSAYAIDPAKKSATVTIADNDSGPSPVINSVTTTGQVFSTMTLKGTFPSAATNVVRVSDGAGYSVDLPVVSATPTQIVARVPAYFNMTTGRLASGAVSVRVVQTSLRMSSSWPALAVTLPSNVVSVNVSSIANLPAGLPAGTVTTALLKAQRTAAQNALTYILSGGLNSQALANSYKAQIKAYDAQIAQFESIIKGTGSTFTVPLGSGKSATFDRSVLADADRVILQVVRAESANWAANNVGAQFINAASSNNKAAIEATANTYVDKKWSSQDTADATTFVNDTVGPLDSLFAIVSAFSKSTAVGQAATLFTVGTSLSTAIAADNAAYIASVDESPINRQRAQKAHDKVIGVIRDIGIAAVNPYAGAGWAAVQLNGTLTDAAYTGIPKLILVATEAQTVESDGNRGMFSLGISGNAVGMKLRWAFSGKAINGTDFQKLPAEETVQSSDGDSLDIPVVPMIDSDDNEGIESVTLTIKNTIDDPYLVIGTASATVEIADRPKFTVTAAPGEIPSDGSTSGTFTFTRVGAPYGNVDLRYINTGTATVGMFTATNRAFSGFIPFAPGDTSLTLVVKANEQGRDKTIKLDLSPNTKKYTLGSPANASILIKNKTTVSIYKMADAAREGGIVDLDGNVTGLAKFRVERTGTTAKALTVKLAHDTAVAAAALADDLQSAVPTSVVIPANASFVEFTLVAKADTKKESTEKLAVKIVPDAATYVIDSARASASVDVIDDVKGRLNGNWAGTINLSTPLNGTDGKFNTNGAKVALNGSMKLQLTALDFYTVQGFKVGGVSGIVNSLTGFKGTQGSVVNKEYYKPTGLDTQPAPLDQAGTLGNDINAPFSVITPADAFEAYLLFTVKYDRVLSFTTLSSATQQQVKCSISVSGDTLTGTFMNNGATGSFTLKRA